MKAVAIKKSSREQAVGLHEMGAFRCDGCGKEFFLGHHPASVDKWVAESKQSGSRRSLLKSTIAIRNTRPESNCRPSIRCGQKASRKSAQRKPAS
jgi:hypothetical protein